MEVHSTSFVLGEKNIMVEVGKFAYQANTSLTIKCEDTILLVTVVASKKVSEEIDFFPLMCDYEEKLYAAGKIPGGFFKREGRPSEKAILTSRLIDRSIRPFFPRGFAGEVQVIATPLSVDIQYPPEVFAVLGASFALCISDIPWLGPIGIVRVSYKDGNFTISPTSAQLQDSVLDMVVAGKEGKIVMIETKAKQIEEKLIIDAINFALPHLNKLIECQQDLTKKIGKVKMEFTPNIIPEDILQKVKEKSEDKVYRIFKGGLGKKEREESTDQLLVEVQAELKEIFPDENRKINFAYQYILKDALRKMTISENVRVDGRGLTDIRNITCEAGILPRTHGSGLFTRGETQVLTTTTLGAVGDEQIIDGLGEEETKRFMHQYNFPPFSVGEIRPLRGPGRRDIGHGALAEKSLENILPQEDIFPYTIRLVSEVLSSNGSTSMASVCASTLSLMDAGIPILSPVAGIAVGLMVDEDKVAILSDISGIEDAFGDMDFKVAGTKEGVCALQLDIKSNSLTLEILERALKQAKEGRLDILDKMLKIISSPRLHLSCFAPRIFKIEVPTDKIGEIIGPGGKNIKRIIEEAKVKIDIQDNKFVYITAPDENAGKLAKDMIEMQIRDPQVGEIYSGKVVRIVTFGAFVEIAPNKDGLLHISNIAPHRINKVEDVLKIGDKVQVKIIQIDEQGKISLSRKALL